MSRQYVSVRFNQHDEIGYTYHNDGPTVRPGDQLEVETKGGKVRKVECVAIVDQPDFVTKAIRGKAKPPEPPVQAALL